MRKVTLGEVLDVRRGTSLSGEHYATSGKYKRLTLGNFNYPGGGFKENTAKADIYFTGPVKPEFILKKGAIITPLTEQVRGLLGETARIPESNVFIQSGDVGLIIPNENVLDPSFAYYLISSPVVKAQLDAASQQTKIRHTSPEAIKRCVAWIPDLNNQKRIGALLDSINEKISNNNAIISELESMAKDLYDYWFVQFDFPDDNGKPYKSSGGKMVWNEELKRKIPEGWIVKQLNEMCSFSNGINYDKNEIGNKKYHIINVRNITASSFLLNDNEFDEIELKSSQADRYLVNDSDILVARSGAPGAVRLLLNNDKNTIFCGFIIRCIPKDPGFRFYLSFSLKQYEGTNATTTGGSILQNVSQDTLGRVSLVIPPDSVVDAFSSLVSRILYGMQNAIEENQQLSSLRDWLLPMLMNGQVKVGGVA